MAEPDAEELKTQSTIRRACEVAVISLCSVKCHKGEINLVRKYPCTECVKS